MARRLFRACLPISLALPDKVIVVPGNLCSSTDSLVESTKQLCHQEGCTLFMALLAAFKMTVYRYTGQIDLLVGVPIANRNRAEIESLIGCFINTLVVRSDLSGEPTFRELLKREREATMQAYANQDLPLKK